MRNLTPAAMRCIIGSCPSIWELDDGRLQITGALSSNHRLEETIVIDPALLADVFPRIYFGKLEAPANPYEPIDPLYVKPQVEDVI